jgi:hypothetical protein
VIDDKLIWIYVNQEERYGQGIGMYVRQERCIQGFDGET